ncbi:MAG: hypothetical protein AAF551_03310, partial [Bacteroidota bacterium]
MITTQIEGTTKRWKFVFTLLSFVLVLSFLLSLTLGSVSIPISAIFDFFIGEHENQVWNNILKNFRLPKAIT